MTDVQLALPQGAGITAQHAAAMSREQAQVVMDRAGARQFPRDYDDARQKMLAQCRRGRFAAVALYRLPRKMDGETRWITGPSIRLAEMVAQRWGNITIDHFVARDDDERVVHEVVVMDQESGTRYRQSVTVPRTIERKYAKPNAIISSRVNTYGETVHRVAASPEEMRQQTNSEVSRAIRNCILRVVPSELIEEAVEACEAAAKQDAKEAVGNHEKANRLVDSFQAQGITAKQIVAYLGCQVADATPEQIQDLRRIYTAIRENHATWSELTAQEEEAEPKAEAKPKAESQAQEDPEAAKAKRKAKRDLISAMAKHKFTLEDVGELGAQFNPPIKVEAINTLSTVDMERLVQAIADEASMTGGAGSDSPDGPAEEAPPNESQQDDAK